MSRPSTEKIDFPGSQGARLSARLERPTGSPRAYAVFAHCFTCSKDAVAASRISRGLAERKIAVLRFDFTGLGHSDGEFANTNFSSNVGDLIAACRFLEASAQAPRLLIGHSLGGAAVLAAASSVPSVRAVATIGAPAAPQHIEHLLSDDIAEIEATGVACVTIAGRRFRIQRQFLEDIGEQRLSEHVATMRKALLVLHSPTDQTVGIENATSIFVAAKHPKSFVSLDGADHLLTKREDAVFVADILSAWASRYIDEAPVPADRPPDGEVVVETLPGHEFAQRIRVGPHALVGDEPRELGGDELGPSPYDFLAAALGSCTSMTLQMYARRKGIDLRRVATHVRHERLHARDCESCESSTGKIDLLVREIELDGDLDDATRTRLLQIADKCPVHRTLHGEVRVRTSERT